MFVKVLRWNDSWAAYLKQKQMVEVEVVKIQVAKEVLAANEVAQLLIVLLLHQFQMKKLAIEYYLALSKVWVVVWVQLVWKQNVNQSHDDVV